MRFTPLLSGRGFSPIKWYGVPGYLFPAAPIFKKKTELFLYFTLFQPLGKNPLKMVKISNWNGHESVSHSTCDPPVPLLTKSETKVDNDIPD